MPNYTVIKPLALPDGATAEAGSTVALSARQAKYLLLSGKLVPEGDKQSTKATRSAARKKEK